MRTEHFAMLADAIIESVALPMDSFHARIKTLEDADDFTILQEADPGRQYPEKTLKKHRNGLWFYSLKMGKWECVANSIFDLSITQDAGGGLTFRVEMSDGQIIERTTKPAPKKAVTKPVKLIRKPTKRVFLEKA